MSRFEDIESRTANFDGVAYSRYLTAERDRSELTAHVKELRQMLRELREVYTSPHCHYYAKIERLLEW